MSNSNKMLKTPKCLLKINKKLFEENQPELKQKEEPISKPIAEQKEPEQQEEHHSYIRPVSIVEGIGDCHSISVLTYQASPRPMIDPAMQARP